MRGSKGVQVSDAVRVINGQNESCANGVYDGSAGTARLESLLWRDCGYVCVVFGSASDRLMGRRLETVLLGRLQI